MMGVRFWRTALLTVALFAVIYGLLMAVFFSGIHGSSMLGCLPSVLYVSGFISVHIAVSIAIGAGAFRIYRRFADEDGYTPFAGSFIAGLAAVVVFAGIPILVTRGFAPWQDQPFFALVHGLIAIQCIVVAALFGNGLGQKRCS